MFTVSAATDAHIKVCCKVLQEGPQGYWSPSGSSSWHLGYSLGLQEAEQRNERNPQFLSFYSHSTDRLGDE